MRPTQRRLWMSEFGCGSFPISSMETALELSSIILKVRIRAQITLCSRPLMPPFRGFQLIILVFLLHERLLALILLLARSILSNFFN